MITWLSNQWQGIYPNLVASLIAWAFVTAVTVLGLRKTYKAKAAAFWAAHEKLLRGHDALHQRLDELCGAIRPEGDCQ